MTPMSSRRDFLMKTGMAGLGWYIGTGLLSGCGTSKAVAGTGKFNTGFLQTPLAYSYNALNEAIDGTTMEIHYSKHAAGYATNLQNAAKNENVDASKPLEDVLRRISKYSATAHYSAFHFQYGKTMMRFCCKLNR